MAVQVTLEFTDAQWALVQEHYSIVGLNELNRPEKVAVTIDSLGEWLTKIVQVEIETCIRQVARDEADKTTENSFNV